MTSLYLRLAAPVQSWAAHRVTGNVVHTEPHPTPSALRGLLAACCGWPRGQWEPWIHDVGITVRIDQAGTVIDEYQTVNPRDEDLRFQQRLHPLLTGRSWSGQSIHTPDSQRMTAIVRRTYLADAAFLVEIDAGEHTAALRSAVREPAFLPYLGKKAFAPTFPFFLGAGESGLISSLPTVETEVDAIDRRRLQWAKRVTPGASTSSTSGTGPDAEDPSSEVDRSLRADEVRRKVRLIEAGSPAAPRSVAEVPVLPMPQWLDHVGAALVR